MCSSVQERYALLNSDWTSGFFPSVHARISAEYALYSCAVGCMHVVVLVHADSPAQAHTVCLSSAAVIRCINAQAMSVVYSTLMHFLYTHNYISAFFPFQLFLQTLAPSTHVIYSGALWWWRRQRSYIEPVAVRALFCTYFGRFRRLHETFQTFRFALSR